MHFADIKIVDFGKSDRQKHEGYGDGKSLGAGMEEAFAEREQPAHQRAERKGKHDFKNGVDDNRNDVYVARTKRFCNTKRNSELSR